MKRSFDRVVEEIEVKDRMLVLVLHSRKCDFSLMQCADHTDCSLNSNQILTGTDKSSSKADPLPSVL